jgi:integrase
MPGRRQQGEGSVFRRSRDGRWVARADLGWRGGKRDQRLFVAATPEEAIRRRAEFLARRRDGFTAPKGRPLYVSEWMAHWLHNIARRKVEATTWDRSYRQKVTELICPFFERIPLAELSEDDIEAWHAHLEEAVSARTGRPLSASTIGQAHRIMSRGIKVAVARGKLPRNPLSNVTPPAASRPVPSPPARGDVDRILQRCGTWPNGARWVVALQTGLRQGEALALRWPDVRLADPASVTVRRSAARTSEGLVYKQPKSAKSRRTVELTAMAVAALREHRKGAVAEIGGLVFTRPGGGPVHPRADYADWHALLDDLGIPRCRVHDCRHAVATMLLEAGEDPRVVQDIMGWSTAAMAEIYQHVRPALQRQALGRALGGG